MSWCVRVCMYVRVRVHVLRVHVRVRVRVHAGGSGRWHACSSASVALLTSNSKSCVAQVTCARLACPSPCSPRAAICFRRACSTCAQSVRSSLTYEGSAA